MFLTHFQFNRQGQISGIFKFLILVFLLSVLVVNGRAKADLTDIPVIYVTSDITLNTTWTSDYVYYITHNISIASGATLTIQAGTIVKFDVPFIPTPSNIYKLTVIGNLDLQGTTDQPVLFTSGRDDTAGGDSNGDLNQTLPAAGDWNAITLVNWSSNINNVIVRYAYNGIQIQNNSASSISPTVHDNHFTQSVCGLTLSVNSVADILATVENNIFSQNHYGLCTTIESSTGASRPLVKNNTFELNNVLPIYLNGSAYPSYENNNIFIGYPNPDQRLGIGLGASFYGTGEWTKVNDMPYIVVQTVKVQANANITLPAGSVVKSFTRYDTGITPASIPEIQIIGTLNLPSTELQPITFTSYRDNSIAGDTNGDGTDTEPYPGDWKQVNFRDNKSTIDPDLTFQYLEFRYAQNGFLYETTITGSTRHPTVSNCIFYKNINGLRFKAYNNSSSSRIEPNVQNNEFREQGILITDISQLEPGVPIYLENVIQPVYAGNTFIGNLHPAIGLGGTWRSSTILMSVSGQGLDRLPFLIHGTVGIGNISTNDPDNTMTLEIPAGTVIKFYANQFNTAPSAGVHANGLLLLTSTTDDPIVFTSYYDSLFGGNTSGETHTPTRLDWNSVTIRNPGSHVSNTIFRWGNKALNIQNKGAGFL